MADKTMNLKPFHAEFKPEGGGFVLEFWGATEGNKRVKVRLHFEFWWTCFLARILWQVIAHREDEVKQARHSMTAPQ
jgi:hypothetical protein